MYSKERGFRRGEKITKNGHDKTSRRKLNLNFENSFSSRGSKSPKSLSSRLTDLATDRTVNSKKSIC